MNSNKGWGFMEYLTVAGIFTILYKLCRFSMGGFSAFVSLFKLFFLVVVIGWGWIGVYFLIDVTPSYVWKIILVAVCTLLFLVGYNTYVVTKKNKEVKEVEHEEFVKAIVFAENFLRNLPFHYYDSEKQKFSDWLVNNNLVKSFSTWDETQRLVRLGDVTGKYYVCSLSCMTPEQVKAKRNAAWEKQKDNQRQAQLKKNAENKKARKESANNSLSPE